jgi:hypothetical protein
MANFSNDTQIESLHFLRDYIYTNPFWPRPFFIYIHCQSGNPHRESQPSSTSIRR